VSSHKPLSARDYEHNGCRQQGLREAPGSFPPSPLRLGFSPSTSALKGFLVDMQRLAPFSTEFNITMSMILRFS
jgi:hypothetical protein